MKLKELVDHVVAEFKGYVDDRLAKLKADPEQRGPKGDAPTIDEVRAVIEPLVKEAAERVASACDEVIKAIPPAPTIEQVREDLAPVLDELRAAAVPGADATPEQIAAAVDKALPLLIDRAHTELVDHIDEAVKAIPAPVNGTNGTSVTIEQVREDLAPVLDELRAAAVPGPKGDSVTIEQVREDLAPVLDELRGLAKPGPKGDSVTIEQVQELIAPVVDELRAALPTIDDVREDLAPLVDELRAAAVPGPKGDSITDAHVEQLLQRVDAQVDKHMTEVRERVIGPTLDECRAKAQPGKNGDSVTVEQVIAAFMPTFMQRMTDEMAKGIGTVQASVKHGEHGRDALMLDVLPCIDTTRSYGPRTYAWHRNGMIQSMRNTDPLVDGMTLEKAGWHVGIDMPFEKLANVIDDRTTEYVDVYTSGREVKRTEVSTTAIYRGVFISGDEKEYRKGDTATWDGGTWHANVTTKNAPGTVAGEWTLMVRRGKPGTTR